eukprot:1133671-Pelagomonas_calceolata.AAC.7
MHTHAHTYTHAYVNGTSASILNKIYKVQQQAELHACPQVFKWSCKLCMRWRYRPFCTARLDPGQSFPLRATGKKCMPCRNFSTHAGNGP